MVEPKKGQLQSRVRVTDDDVTGMTCSAKRHGRAHPASDMVIARYLRQDVVPDRLQVQALLI